MKEKTIKKISRKGVCCHYPGERGPRFMEPFLLLILLKNKAHGYEILQKLKNMGLEYEAEDIGHVYRNLRKLEKQGFLKSEWHTQGSGPPQRVYKITKMGKAKLKEWYSAIKRIIKNLNFFLKEYEKEV